jgi:hypothetical protein
MMCDFFSCIIDRNLKVHYDGNESSHEKIIEKAGLKDSKLVDRDFVRIEIVPSKLTMNPKDWVLKVDEEKTLPDWFTKNREKADRKCYAALFAYLKVCHIAEVAEFVDSLKKIKYFDMHGKLKKEWKMFYGNTWSAARSAADSAAYSAAYSAARSAARSAADSAAYSAARSAAYSAARSAARSAADSAARSAADSAAYSAADSAALLTRFIVISDLVKKDKKLQKHFQHAEKEMEVWKRGWALLTDVNGVLYVYGVKK